MATVKALREVCRNDRKALGWHCSFVLLIAANYLCFPLLVVGCVNSVMLQDIKQGGRFQKVS
ncbi:MAG: hypothetical protein HUU08_01035 [Candidatus Brocadia sp.]|nr:hypothetical protein [Candidatus Brocadia sp.]